jgi:hypothetical protein
VFLLKVLCYNNFGNDLRKVRRLDRR